jgi:hypothetical protein
VVEGQLTIQTAEVFSGERHPDLALATGQSALVEVGTAHRPFNPGPGRCRFLLLQADGSYDYIPFKPVA